MNLDGLSRVVLCKLEDTAGTDAAPVVGTNDLFVLDDSPGVTVTNTRGEIKPTSPVGGEFPAPIISSSGAFEYRIPFYGKGISGGTTIIKPMWVQTLLQSFCTLTNSGATMTAVPELISPLDTAGSAAKKTFTIYEYVGRAGTPAAGTKTLRKLTGARVTDLEIDLSPGKVMSMTFKGLGLYNEDANSTADVSGYTADGVVSDWVVPNAASTTFDGQATLQNEFKITIKTGSKLTAGDNTGTGFTSVDIDNLAVEVALKARYENVSSFDWLGHVQANVGYAVAMATSIYPDSRSANQGYGFGIALPSVQLVGDFERVSPMMFNATGKATRASLTGAPFTITIR